MDNTLAGEIHRFFSRAHILNQEVCWPWHGAIKKSTGYGLVRFRGNRQETAHRVAYTLLVGPIPPKLQIDHLCRNRWCVNPQHLEAVTIRENVLRGNSFSAINARKTVCKRGHSLDDAYINCENRRMCRQCSHLRYLANKAKSKLPAAT